MPTVSSAQVAVATTLVVIVIMRSTQACAESVAAARVAGEGEECRAAPGLPLQVRLNNGVYGACNIRMVSLQPSWSNEFCGLQICMHRTDQLR